jgi:hypothetical protein
VSGFLDSAIPALYYGEPVAIVGVVGTRNEPKVLVVAPDGSLSYCSVDWIGNDHPPRLRLVTSGASHNILWALDRATAEVPEAKAPETEPPKPTYDHELPKDQE